ncbi:CheY chemotaxis protein or a CheY-like REC (receiver) domain [Pseudobacteriovorax antillogorgiicola]|uniref:CheY chemotaxis protein or a CheY-like REC (Receiver) domain n=1 Tax=Pseudobacteriovorax antillogorgiicola TaxID=1513793 RepID=A0A1Y6CAY3_9BACT|nr:CheY chemotaxis protein or a CheY-like REC (receiver) domain [Pseudobacteriovorax antillogorgiicola]
MGASNVAKILIVEDNEMNRDMLSRRLARRGFEVDCVENGQLAVDYLETESHPDLILMDMRMPVMDGWTATNAIKSNPATEKVPVIGLSANAMEGDRERAMKAGCDEYETKPVNFETLMNVIHKYIPDAA